MNRREALKHLGLGISVGAVGSSLLASCKKDDPGPEVPYNGTVAIIGAGAAGLYAADILTSKGISVVVLEATDRIGGRLKSLRNIKTPTDALLFPVIPDDPSAPISTADFPVELGAESFEGLDSAWGKIVTNLNLNTIDLSVANHRYVMDGVVRPGADWQADSDFVAAQNFVSNLKTLTGAQTIRQAANGIAERAQGLVNAQVGNYYGTNSERLGAGALAEDLSAITHDRTLLALKNNPMQDVLISRFANVVPLVQLNKPVKTIRHSASAVTLDLEDGTQLEVNKVIVTVPLAIMKNGIAFSPALPGSKTAAMSKFDMDPSVRVILDFKKNLWGEDAGFIWGGATAPQYFNGGLTRSEFNRTLSVTVNGPKAAELSAKGKDMIADLLKELDGLYDNQATGFIRRSLVTNEIMYIIQDWSKEPYIRGGYAYPKPNATQADRSIISQPVNNTLFFAGEVTDTLGDAGTLNGALNSAERAANEVIEAILAENGG